MKKLVAFVLLSLIFAMPSQAQWRQHNQHFYRHNGSAIPWVVGGLITGAIVTGIVRQNEQHIVSPPQYPADCSTGRPEVIYNGVVCNSVIATPTTAVIECPLGTMPTYSRRWVQNAQGRYVEVYQYIGCVQQQ